MIFESGSNIQPYEISNSFNRSNLTNRNKYVTFVEI